MIGASQSGKTTALIDSVKHWSGPAVVWSVKTDLMRLTIDAASSRGRFEGLRPPLHQRLTIGPDGARFAPPSRSKVRRPLRHCSYKPQATVRRTTGSGAAKPNSCSPACCGRQRTSTATANVVTWVLNLDIPDDAERGTLAPLVRLLRDSPDNVALEAAEIDGWLQGQWKTDPKTLQDLIEQVLGHANLVGPLTPRVLLCIDETANTPLPKLAE